MLHCYSGNRLRKFLLYSQTFVEHRTTSKFVNKETFNEIYITKYSETAKTQTTSDPAKKFGFWKCPVFGWSDFRKFHCVHLRYFYLVELFHVLFARFTMGSVRCFFFKSNGCQIRFSVCFLMLSRYLIPFICPPACLSASLPVYTTIKYLLKMSLI